MQPQSDSTQHLLVAFSPTCSSQRNLMRDPATTPLRAEVLWGKVHFACRVPGAPNVVEKAGCPEGVHGVSYSLDI